MATTIAGVLTVHEAEGEEARAVFDSPHSGFTLPDGWGCIQPAETLWGAGGIDNYVNDLFAEAPRHGVTFLEALYPRSYIDPNRNEDEIDPDILAEPWPGPLSHSEQVGRGSGLVWRKAIPDLRLYDRKLTVAEVRERIESYWRPYQSALKAALDAAHARYGCVYHLDCHSNRTVAPPGLADDAGTVRPEMELGTLDGATCEPEFTALVSNTLGAMGYEVVVDGFNKGEHLIRHYANPAAGRHSMMLEVRKDLYMDEKTIERNDRFVRTRADMSRLAAAISAYAKEKA